MKLEHPVSRRFGGKTEDGRSLIAYSWSRRKATAMLRQAGVTGRVRRLKGKCVNGKPFLPPGKPKVDLLGKLVVSR